MAADLEYNFFYRLKLITTLLIKHASSEYRDLLPIVQEHEDRTWKDLSPSQKYQRLESLRTQAGLDSAVTKHFAEFPHQWSRNQFEAFLESLDLYCSQLKEQLG